MAKIQFQTEDGSMLGNPPAGKYFIFLDSSNSDSLTLRDDSGNDTVYASGTIPTQLNDLSDVIITALADNQIIMSTGGNFKNFLLELNRCDDVNITTPATGQYLVYNGSNWVNETVSADQFNVDLDSAEASVTRAVSGGRTTFTVTHSLNTLDLIVQVFRLSDGRGINWRIDRTGVNTIEASRAGTVADGQFRILIQR